MVVVIVGSFPQIGRDLNIIDLIVDPLHVFYVIIFGVYGVFMYNFQRRKDRKASLIRYIPNIP